jgi:cytochrome c553
VTAVSYYKWKEHKKENHMTRLNVLLLCVAASLPILSTNAAETDTSGVEKSKAVTVCAACHGTNGVSVAEHIPNLAGQRVGYLTAQLQAFKDGSRKSEVMNAIAVQLNDDDIAGAAVFFASKTGAGDGAKSALLPNLTKTNVSFPANYKSAFTRYHTFNDADAKQVKHYFANDIALKAAKAGKPLPDGAAIFVEIHAAKLDGNQNPIKGRDNFFVADRLLVYATMASGANWGENIPKMLRNENWHYAMFNADKQLRVEVNHAECLACHLPARKSSYVFTLEQLAAMRNEK